MLTSIPWPSTKAFSRYLLGTLPPEEAAGIDSWMDANPDQVAAMPVVEVRDDFVKLLASAPRDDTPSPEAERIVSNLTQAFQAGAVPVEQVPPFLAGFRFVRELGRGGMGVVYQYHDEKAGRDVAIKVMKPTLAADETSRQRFLREGRATAALDSECVVPIYQVGETEGVPYLVMKYLEGQSLEQWLHDREGRGERIGEAELLWVAADVLTGLAAAHKEGLIHRDIKPANLWVDERTGRVRVLDFGLTRGCEDDGSLTSANVIVGTPDYMSPEQAQPGVRVDGRSDLFSLGCVLYRMAKGKPPYGRESLMGTLTALATETPPPLTALDARVSAYVARLMSKDAGKRPADAGAALAEAKAVRERLKGRPPRRRLLLVALGFATAAAILAGVIVIVIQNKDGRTVVIPNKDGKTVIEVTHGNGGQNEIPLPPVTDKEAREGEKLLPVGARVEVTAYTSGYENQDTGTVRAFIDQGSKGKVIDVAKNKGSYRVLLDGPGEVKVWIICRSVKAE